MQKKIASILFSTRLTAVLFIVFAISMAIGTWLDRAMETSPTPYSREMVYNAWWFEAIMVFFVINFLGNIFRFKLYRKEKWSTLVIHLSFILILVGAFITRYIGFEGVLPIREGATENVVLSEHAYLDTFIDGDYKINGVVQRRQLGQRRMNLSARLDNSFSIESDYNKQPVSITYKDFIPNAKEDLIPSEAGEAYIKIVEAGDGNRHDHWLKMGEVANIHNILFALNKPTAGAINIGYEEDGSYTIAAPFEGNYMRMADQFQGTVVKDSVQPLMLRSLYSMAGMSFVIPEPVTKGEYGIVSAPNGEVTNQDALILEVNSKGETKKAELLGGRGSLPDPTMVEVGGLKVYMRYGSKEHVLPFSITLNDFIADKYPGTEKGYSAFKSKITVNDSEKDFFDYEIYMNHVLDHKGYRFFQARFDPDEKGSVLSVNHDFWGTWVTYIGYFLLYLGLMLILFDKNSRFGALKRQLDKVKAKKNSLLTLMFLVMSVASYSQDTDTHEAHATPVRTPVAQLDSLILKNAVSKEHALRFSKLIIQDDGRMKPVNTFASELLRKVSGRNSYQDLDANQVFISMVEFPNLWAQVPLIKLKRGNDSIRSVVGVDKKASRIALVDLFDRDVNYKLKPYLEAATGTNTPNQFQKDFIKAHENYYLLSEAMGGGILKIFPIPGDEGNKWISYPELSNSGITGKDSVFVSTSLPTYFTVLKDARKTGDYSNAEKVLDIITNEYQKNYGSEVFPDAKKTEAEILYNKVDIFNRLYKYFGMFGLLMFVFLIVQIFNEGKAVAVLVTICKYLIWTLFILMTFGLIARWYISGHAPWSDAYESILYVGWATTFFGLAFGRKSDLTIASTAFVVTMILWVANQSWLDPAIANLQPVLDSYWLMIHVAVIVASYGPFTLGMILGMTSLLLMILTTRNNKVKMELNIKELTIITELALTVGLVMLTIGNFLGGQWANESWGRYWGWDPKETWALISIMVYAFVIHARLVPGLRSKWFFNVMAMGAYASIMITYFGVNFYLTGLHSYASGDVPVTPMFVWYIAGIFVLIWVVSYFRYKKHYTKKG